MGPPAAHRTNTHLHAADVFGEKQMKQSRLIETKSTPCLCELPFSWLKTLTVGNYRAAEHQSLKLMCNQRLEPDIKENLTFFGSQKPPCIYNSKDHCDPAITHLYSCCFVIVLHRKVKALSHHTSNTTTSQLRSC